MRDRLRRAANNTTVQAVAFVAWCFCIWLGIFGPLVFGCGR